MGVVGGKMHLQAKVDSPDGTGKSVISSPIDSLGLTEERFWELFERARRAPIKTPADQPRVQVLKHQVIELGPGAFRVIETVGGLNWGQTQITMTNIFDLQQRLWRTEVDHDLGWNEVPVVMFTRLLLNPMRVESWLVNSPARVAGPALADAVTNTLGAILKKTRSDKGALAVQPFADSLCCPGQRSILTGPLDHLLSADALWDLLEANYRSGVPLPFVTSNRVKDLPNGAFQVTQSVAFGIKVIHTVVQINRSGNMASVAYYDQGSSPGLFEEDRVQTIQARVHRNPLRLEVWADVHPKRHAEEIVKSVMQGVLDIVVEEAEKDRAAARAAVTSSSQSLGRASQLFQGFGNLVPTLRQRA